MLTADQIEALGHKAQKLLDPVQDFLIREIASRITEAGSMTATAQYQVWRLQNLGMSQRKMKKELRRLLKISHRDLRKLLYEAGDNGYSYDISKLPKIQAIPFKESKVMQDIVSAAVDLARDDLTNITQTMGFCMDAEGKVCLPLTQAYEQACDNAFMKVSTGAQDFQSAVREATRGLAKKGIQYIDYESGIHTSLEVAARRSVMGGMGLMQEKISQGVHDDCGCDGWEISAHGCSAPDHEPIQGRQYSDAEFQKLNDSLKRRIGTLNCGHAAHPIILGISKPQYTEQELRFFREENQKGVTVDGKHYTGYEATQKQRAIERAMRAKKKEIIVAEVTGNPNLSQLQSRMRVLSQEYSRFSDQAGLRTQIERTHVAVTDRDVSRIDYVYSKDEDTQEKAKAFSLEREKEKYRNFLQTVPKKNKIYLEQSFNAVEYEENSVLNGPIGYHFGDDKVYFNSSHPQFAMLDFKIVNTHELSHRIDNFFVKSWKKQYFQDAIEKAAIDIVQNHVEIVDFCFENDRFGYLSDICSAICNDEYQFPFGHRKAYWEKEGKRAKEIFANIFSLEAIQDKRSITFLNQYFAELMETYSMLLEDSGIGGN